MQLEPITKAEWGQWKSQKVTKKLVSDLLERRKDLLEDWAEGRCSSQEEETRFQGRIQNLKDIVMYIVQDFEVVDPETQQEKMKNDD